MPTHTWDLAVVELVYYIPSVIPTLYCTWAYRRSALVGWLLMFIFVMLQVIGSGMIAGAGQEGHPSTIATILVAVGLSPLMLGIAGIIHGWAKATGYYKTSKSEKYGTILMLVYHIAVVTAIAIYATGMSQSAKPATHSSGKVIAQAGIVLLLGLSMFMALAFIILMFSSRTHPLQPLLVAIVVCFILLKARLIFQCVIVFLNYGPSIALKVIFEFLPGAFILLALVTGGVMCARKQNELCEAERTDVQLRPWSSSKENG